MGGAPGPQLRVAGQLVGDRLAPLDQSPGQGEDLTHLLVGEGQPGADLGVDAGLTPHVVGHVLEGGGGGYGDGRARGQRVTQRLQGGQRGAEVGAPDIAPRDHPGHHGLTLQGGQVLGVGQAAGHQVQADGLHPGGAQDGQGRAERAVGAGHEDPGALGHGGQKRVGLVDGREDPLLRHVPGVAGQGGLVELDPGGARGPQVDQEVGVGVQDVTQAVQGVEVPAGGVGGLGQEEVGDGAHHHGPHVRPGAGGLQDLGHRAVGGVHGAEAEGVAHRGGLVQLGHQVVVVGVQPLGHLGGGALALAAGHGEVLLQAQSGEALAGGAAQVGKALGDGPQGGGDLVDLVVVGEVGRYGGGPAQAQGGQVRTGGRTQVGGGGTQVSQGGGAAPGRLQGLLELPVSANTRVAQDRGPRQGGQGAGRGLVGGGAHAFSLMVVSMVCGWAGWRGAPAAARPPRRRKEGPRPGVAWR